MLDYCYYEINSIYHSNRKIFDTIFRDFQQLQQSSGLVVNTISKLLGKNRRHRLLVLLLERKLTDAAHASGAASCAAGAGGRG